MTNLSRTKKYQELRNSLQHDTSLDSLSTNDLSRYEKRLNEIDAQNFSLPNTNIRDEHSAEHARNVDMKRSQDVEPLRRKQNAKQPFFDTASYNTKDYSTFDNDYLDQYIREVKQYNIDQGNAESENTQLNILQQIERNNQKTPNRPFQRKKDDTADIPFVSSKKQAQSTSYASAPSQPTTDAQPTQSMSKEDIMEEVQSLVNGTSTPTSEESSPFVSDAYHYENTMGSDTFNRHIEADRTTRQQLLNETTQMRAQLDDYEDNLSEVTDKMRQTNRILNIVLVILIIALAFIVGIVIYWILISK